MTSLLRAEALKITTTRGVWGYLLAVASITAISVSTQIATTPRELLATPESAEDVLAAAGSASLFALLAGLGVFTGEWRHGTITQTFLVEPVRERVLAAKVVVSAALGVVFGAIAVAVALALALPWLSSRDVDLDLGRREHLLILLGAVASSALWGALGAAIGAVVRREVFAIVGVLVWILIVENILGGLVSDVAPYLPGRASGAMIGSEFVNDELSRIAGTLLTLVYVAGFSALALAELRRRDVS